MEGSFYNLELTFKHQNQKSTKWPKKRNPKLERRARRESQRLPKVDLLKSKFSKAEKSEPSVASRQETLPETSMADTSPRRSPLRVRRTSG